MDAVVKDLTADKQKTDEMTGRPTQKQAEEAVRTLIAWAGDDPDREGLKDTPKRVVKAYREFFAGYEDDPDVVLTRTFEDVGGYDDIVMLRDIDFSSHCEHHIVPFIGRLHIAYLPTDKVVGISKLTRVADIYARRMQTQETMTAQIAGSVDRALEPRGVAVMIEAIHQCMSMRGIQKPGAVTITSAVRGIFLSEATRAEAMSLIGVGR